MGALSASSLHSSCDSPKTAIACCGSLGLQAEEDLLQFVTFLVVSSDTIHHRQRGRNSTGCA